MQMKHLPACRPRRHCLRNQAATDTSARQPPPRPSDWLVPLSARSSSLCVRTGDGEGDGVCKASSSKQQATSIEAGPTTRLNALLYKASRIVPFLYWYNRYKLALELYEDLCAWEWVCEKREGETGVVHFEICRDFTLGSPKRGRWLSALVAGLGLQHVLKHMRE